MIDLHAIIDEPDQFITWLESHDPNDVVGRSREFDLCPIATFLRETLQTNRIGSVSVTDKIRVVTINERLEMKTPDWAQDFIGGVDTISDLPIPILANTALNCII